MYECPWLAVARKYIGQREIPGPRHSSFILKLWRRIKRPYIDDETPWCAAFVGYCIEACGLGLTSTRSEAARSYQNWGVRIDKPIPGCVVVFWRGSRDGYSGHVGFVTGLTRDGHLIVLGGNQGDEVNEKAFARDRVLSYRWPLGVNVPKEALKTSWQKVTLSTNEA
jgi:uncharacterized protein (TIGR02594 family)